VTFGSQTTGKDIQQGFHRAGCCSKGRQEGWGLCRSMKSVGEPIATTTSGLRVLTKFCTSWICQVSS